MVRIFNAVEELVADAEKILGPVTGLSLWPRDD
jgi:hypothetical protein